VIEVHLATADGWRALRDIRLRALADAPDAFGSTLARESSRNEAEWRSWASGWDDALDQALFVAQAQDRWIGLALGVRWAEDPEIGHLYAMWVEPQSRRTGVGRALVEAVIDWARAAGLRTIQLLVTASNHEAVAFYRRCGFVDTGNREPLREGSVLVTMRMRREL
jgi:GNAT superfamily N-acetyltransferase